MRICRKCGFKKEEKEFCISKQISRSNLCRSCYKQYQHEWKKNHPQSELHHKKLYRERHKQQIKAYAKTWHEKWRNANREKKHAHDAVRSAIRTGILTRPDKCALCSKSKHIEAHHPDYTKQLDVIWVCQDCHSKIEANILPLPTRKKSPSPLRYVA